MKPDTWVLVEGLIRQGYGFDLTHREGVWYAYFTWEEAGPPSWGTDLDEVIREAERLIMGEGRACAVQP